MQQEELHHPKRDLSLQAAENVRDLGGYRTVDGDRTCFGRFVRSGDMDQLTAADRATLITHGVGTVVDLRMKWEIAEKPNVFSDSEEVNFLVHDFWGDRFDDYRSSDRTASPAKKLADLYCAGLTKSGFVMAEIMQTFADSSQHGYAFHCRSGKDRTGLVAAVLLAIARVPEQTICADFALTSVYLNTEAVNPIDASTPGAWQRGCEPETMERTLEFLARNYGGVAGYLSDIGVTESQQQAIREKLLG